MVRFPDRFNFGKNYAVLEKYNEGEIEDVERLISRVLRFYRENAEEGSLMLDPLRPPEEAARQLGVKIQTLTNWRNQRIGPECVRLGGRVIRYRQSALDAYVKTLEGVDTA